ncbi:outer membrane protein assembly factor BamB family protein [Natronococcus wangiae]|uniref:outer membrane protein assembly factor BamB family protein n=1 Tax=Natronococcus wangiae TaxID=3068275 RepID=UPI00273F91BD|nr:PQQ-binding-like beta-propeller repeat protein [Natronococcus sp. AD5]
MPSITRRRVLAAVGGIGALSIGALGVESVAGPAPTFHEASVPDGDWPAHRRDSRRTAAAPNARRATEEPHVDWEVEVPDQSALVVADGRAYVGGERGVAAVVLEDGSELWTSDAPGETLCHAGDTVYCGESRYGTLTALENDTGERRFELEESFHRVWDPLALEDVLLVGDHGMLRGCDPATGAVEWERNIGGNGDVYPAVADERLYVGGPGPLETYGPREGWDAVRHDGPQQLERGIGPVFATAPAVSDGVYLGGHAGLRETAAFEFDRDGRPVWEGPSGHNVSSPALAGDHGVLWSQNREREPEYQVHGIDLETGETNWSEPFEDVPATPVVAGGLAIVGGRDGSLVALEPETGDSVWETVLENRVGIVVPSADLLLTVGWDVG